MSARRFKPYPAYKDAGVEWLGEIPAHWRVNRTKFAARLRSGHTPSRQHPEYWQDCTIPWFGLADVWQIRDGQTEYVSQTAEKISELGLANSSARLLPKGTVMLSRTASVGFSTIMGVDMATTQDFVNWVCGPTLRPEYLLYVFRSMQQEFRRLTMGSTHQTIYMPDVERFSTPIPPVSEQNQIVAFIRKETSRIDRLVAKKEQLINLLQQKRTALIARAVTTGLDAKVRLVETGSAVFPEIPEHWNLRKLRRLIRRVKRPVVVEPDIQYREIGIRSWGKGIFHKEPLRGALLEDKSVFHIEPNDLVLNIVFAWEGAVALAGASEFGMVASHRFPTFQHSKEVDLDYLLLVLQSEQGRAVMGINSPGAAGRNRTIRLDQFLDEGVPLPTLAEQREIVQAFRSDEKRVEALLAKVREAIDGLHELRTALISAAVTGKIDVREKVAAGTDQS